MSDPIDFIVSGVDPTSPKRICSICGRTISQHNTRGYCFHHPDERKDEFETEKQLRETRAAAALRRLNARTEMQAILQEGKQRDKEVTFHEADLIVELFCGDRGMTREELFEKTRRLRIAHPRQILMFLLYNDTELTYPAIGQLLNGFDHTTVMHGVEKIAEEQIFNPITRETIARIRSSYPETRKT